MIPETDANAVYPDLPPDLILLGNEPAQIKPVHDTLPPTEPAQQGMELGFNGPQSSQAALDYASHILGKKEGVDLTVLSDRWSTSIVLEDVPKNGEDQKVYKIFRSSENYPKVESEMGNLTLLYAHDLAPKPHLLIDAASEYRAAPGIKHVQESASTQIVRQDCGGSLPIIVMDKVEAVPVDTMPDEQLQAEFTRVVQTTKELKLALSDTEIVYDKKQQRVTCIDAGGIGRYDENRLVHLRQLYQGYTDDQLITAHVIANTMSYFLSGKGAPEFTADPQTFLRVMQEHTPEETMAMSLRPLMKYTRQGSPAEIYNPPNHWQPGA